FFCQAEDGIRDWSVTGVQTCALPICANGARKSVENTRMRASARPKLGSANAWATSGRPAKYSAISRGCTRPTYMASAMVEPMARSEERRVGKEGRCGWGGEREKTRER